MSYTKENFQEWIFLISDKIDYLTSVFAKEQGLVLDYSLKSLDQLERWLLLHFENSSEIIVDDKAELLDYLLIYVGQTFRQYIGGRWVIDLDNKQNVYYSMPVLTDRYYKGAIYKAPMLLITASINRKTGDFISTVLRNNMKQMGVEEK